MKRFEYFKPESRKETKWTKLEDSETTRLWLHKRTIETAEVLPNVLQWSKVDKHLPVVELSPLDCAISTMRKKNNELLELAQLIYTNPVENVMPLGGNIRGVLQANVGGGIANYKA